MKASSGEAADRMLFAGCKGKEKQAMPPNGRTAIACFFAREVFTYL